jgi:hypothetical protein
MKSKIFHLVIFSFAVIIFSGYANLKQINDYSSKSLDGIKKFEDIDYSFTRYCFERCQFDAVRKFEIKRETECNCDVYSAADSVTLLIYNAIRGYFGGLTSLSDNELTTYHFDAVQKSLAAGNFGDIRIDSEQVAAYSNICKILLRAITDLYQKKKIKQYIEAANQPIQILLQKFQFILQKDLEGELNFKKEALYAYYKEMNLNGNISDYEKGKATIDYYRQLADINQKQNQIDALAKGLECMAKGHQKLYDNRDKLNAKEIKVLFSQYSSDIQDVISEFNKLKN